MTFDQLRTGLILLALAALACTMPAHSDTWWLLRTGQVTLQSGSAVLHDEFSYTAAGNFWPNHAWLAQVLFYLVHALGGLRLFTLVAAAFVLASVVLSWRLMRGPADLRLLLFAACTALTTTQWALRPQVVTLFCIAATATLAITKRYWWLPPLFMLWANAHTAVALGMVSLIGWTLVALPDAGRERLVRVIVTTACGVATLFNPLGIALWTELPASVRLSGIIQLNEWAPPSTTTPLYVLFWALAGALVLLAIFRWRRLDNDDKAILAMALSLAPLAMRSQRIVAPFVLLATPALSRLLFTRTNETRVRKPQPERRVVNATLFGCAALVMIVWVTRSWAEGGARLGWQPLGREAIDGLRRCRGNLYNTFEEGGPVIWFVPERKVFLDNRQDPYPASFLLEAYNIERTGDFKSPFKKYDIRCALVPQGSELEHNLQAAGWGRLAADGIHSVWAEPGS